MFCSLAFVAALEQCGERGKPQYRNGQRLDFRQLQLFKSNPSYLGASFASTRQVPTARTVGRQLPHSRVNSPCYLGIKPQPVAKLGTKLTSLSLLQAS